MASKLAKLPPKFAVCVKNADCDDLVVRKLYRVLADDKALHEGFLRIVDESGEDYLYPAGYFVLLELPAAARRIFGAAKRRTVAAA